MNAKLRRTSASGFSSSGTVCTLADRNDSAIRPAHRRPGCRAGRRYRAGVPAAHALDALAHWPVATAAGAVVIPPASSRPSVPPAGGHASRRSPSPWRDRRASSPSRRGRSTSRRPLGRPGRPCATCWPTPRGCRSRAPPRSPRPGAGGSTPTRGSTSLGDELSAAAGHAGRRVPRRGGARRRWAWGAPSCGGRWRRTPGRRSRTSPRFAARAAAHRRLVAPETLAEAVTEQFPGLAGVVPGLGSYDPNPWGLGFELKGAKSPHWTAPDGSPRTFGHFGGAGTFLWVDPDAGGGVRRAHRPRVRRLGAPAVVRAVGRGARPPTRADPDRGRAMPGLRRHGDGLAH